MMETGIRKIGGSVLLAALLVAGACVPLSAQQVPDRPANGSAEVAAPFSAKTLSGEVVALDSLLRGKRFLVVTFWGLNCSPCIKEIARLNALSATPAFREQAALLAVNTDKIGPKRLAAEMAKRDIRIAFPVVADEGYEITNSYVNGLIPLTVLIDGERRIRMSILGADPEEMSVLEKVVLSGRGGRDR